MRWRSITVLLYTACWLLLGGQPLLAEQLGLRELIQLGLRENFGLQAEALSVDIGSEEIDLQDAQFDAELFASFGYLRDVTPYSVLSVSDRSKSDLLQGQLGLQKRFAYGQQLKLSLDSQWLDDNDSNEDLDPRYRTALNLSLSQPLLRNFGKQVNRTRVELARNQRSQAELNYRLQAQQLALQIVIDASRYAGESRVLAMRQQAVALAEELLTANRRRFDSGVIPITEVQEAETALADRQLNLSLAQQNAQLAFASLNRLLNQQLPDEFRADQLYPFAVVLLPESLPSSEQQLEELQAKNLSLQLAEIDIDSAIRQRDYAHNQLLPQLDLNLQAGLNGLSGDRRTGVSSRYAGSWPESFGSAAAADGYQWKAGLQFTLPLGNRAAQSRLRQAQLQEQQVRYRQRDLQVELRDELIQQRVTLQRAIEQAKLAARFEQLAELSLQQEQRRQAEGLSDTFRIIAFQDKMINARIGRVNALTQYYLAAAQLDFVRGAILEQYRLELPKNLMENSREDS